MKISAVEGLITEFPCDLLVVNEFEGVKKPGGATGAVDKALGGLISKLTAAKEIDGKLGSFTVIHTQGKLPAERVVVVGLGKAEKFGLEEVRKASAAAIKAAKKAKAKKVATIVHGAGIGGLEVKAATEATVVGAILADYEFKGKKSIEEDKNVPIAELVIIDHTKAKLAAIKAGINYAEVVSSATNAARDMVNSPGNMMTPEAFARIAEQVAKAAGLSIKVLDLADIKKAKMGAFLSVAKGSDEEPKLVVLKYKPAGVKGKETIGLVGKGITFDSGGISIKPAKKMDEMKDDMAGAAAVLMTMKALSQLKVKKDVLAVIPLAENMPSGHAVKPGDVVTAANGKTIEINNTDAEGRLILADALTYAQEQGAHTVIDIATLTGGVTIALGDAASGIVGNDQKLIDGLVKAGSDAGEKLWQLPLYDEFKEYLESSVADVKNSTEHGKASSSVGGTFLANFINEGTKWAHIDIAGTALVEKASGYLGAGASGVGVRTLVRYLCS